MTTNIMTATANHLKVIEELSAHIADLYAEINRKNDEIAFRDAIIAELKAATTVAAPVAPAPINPVAAKPATPKPIKPKPIKRAVPAPVAAKPATPKPIKPKPIKRAVPAPVAAPSSCKAALQRGSDSKKATPKPVEKGLDAARVDKAIFTAYKSGLYEKHDRGLVDKAVNMAAASKEPITASVIERMLWDLVEFF